MIENDLRRHMKKWIGIMLENDIITRFSGCLSVRNNTMMLITPRGIDFENYAEEDGIFINMGINADFPDQNIRLHATVYHHRNDFNVLVQSVLPGTMTSSKAGREVFPMLDDIAQIVGATVKTAEYDMDDVNAKPHTVLRQLRRRSGVLLRNNGALCGAGNYDDAQAVVQVLEKGCKAFIETTFLGGGKRINCIEANLMRLVYILKYSKQNSLNRGV